MDLGPPSEIALPAPGVGLVIARDRSAQADIVIDDRSLARGAHLRILRSSASEVQVESLCERSIEVDARALMSAQVPDGAWLRIGSWPYERVGERLVLRRDADGLSLRARSLSVEIETPAGLKRLLDELDFDLDGRQMLAIIGPSGCGKSTLLRALCAEQSLSSGHLWAEDDRGPVSEQSLAGAIGFVPQDDALIDELTVRTSLELAAKLRRPGSDSAARQRVVRQTMSQLGLDGLADRRIGGGLSGGQRKRVSIAQELVGRPRLLCLDEPAASLDAALELDFMAQLRLTAARGTTIVCVTHGLAALSLFDKVLVMAPAGRIAWCGVPSDLRKSFEVDDLVQIFDRLKDPDFKIPGPVGTLSDSAPPQNAELRAIPPAASGLSRFKVLLERNLRLRCQARALLPFLALAFGLGLSIRLALPDLVDRDAILFFSILSSLWLGMQSASLELVSERAIFQQERRIGVPLSAWISAKWVSLIALGSLQALILYLAGWLSFRESLRGFPTGVLPAYLSELEGSNLLPALSLLFAQALGVVLGLATSSIARSERQAGLTVPLLVIPMLLFSAHGMAQGESLGLLSSRKPERISELLSSLNPARLIYESSFDVLREGRNELSRCWPELALLGIAFVAAMILTITAARRRSQRLALTLTSQESSLLAPYAKASEDQRWQAFHSIRTRIRSGRCSSCGFRLQDSDPCARCKTPWNSPESARRVVRRRSIEQAINGLSSPLRGLKKIIEVPEIRRFALLPLLANLVLIAAAAWTAWSLSDWLRNPTLNTQGLGWAFSIVFISLSRIAAELALVFSPIVAGWLFLTLGIPLMMPIMEMLAERITRHELGELHEPEQSTLQTVLGILRGLFDTVLVILLQLSLGLILWPVAWIPVLGPWLWLVLPAALTCAIDFSDINLATRRYGFTEKLRWLWAERWSLASFGILISTLLTLPWLNLLIAPIVLPAATAGAVLIYLESQER
jgi:ABC-type multidrug transport system ATPase subunit/uncharacterized protein involved in cysteine biosynthesis